MNPEISPVNPPSNPARIVIVGAVAGGASAAARARRLLEHAEITLVERGADVSFANCGMPYHIGGEIVDRAALSLHTPETLRAMLDLHVRTRTEALRIDRAGHRLEVRNPDGTTESIPYDRLILAPGASPVRPPIPGADLPGVLTLRDLRDMDSIRARATDARSVAIIGAGFIGIELAEQLRNLGKRIHLVEAEIQVLPQLDPEIALFVEDALRSRGVELALGDPIAAIEASGDGAAVALLRSGTRLAVDLVILSVGIRPESTLARDAGLDVGPRGHIRVDPFLRTSDPDIYAVGDAVEMIDPILGAPCAVALGGPANRQGRTAADHICAPALARPYPGSLGTAIVRAFDVCAAATGWNERRLRQANIPHRATTVTAHRHASYYPGATPVTVKICWAPDDGRLLGAQAVGTDGVDKRIDVLATALRARMTIDDLSHLELAYAPPFGSAKDVVNLAGFCASNTRDQLLRPRATIPAPDPELQIVDVRPAAMAAESPIPGAINIPLPTLRARLGELDPSKPVVTVCMFGKMSYFAARILAQRGFAVESVTGGTRIQRPARA